MKKRILALLLAVSLVTALILPAAGASSYTGAAVSSFSDITNPRVASAVDILRIMGVLNGTGENRFSPNGKLTRAQFCALVIRFLQKEAQVPAYTARTIFSDVPSRHWALGYVNLAASTTLPGEKEGETTRLIAGTGNGRFEPDSDMTMAQAVTILLRAMGYSDQQVGGVWPQGHVSLAKSLGLLTGVTASAGSPITRGQTAILFYNALTSKTADKQIFYESLGFTVTPEKVIVQGINVETESGSQTGAIQTTGGTYLPASGLEIPSSFQGRRGTLILNDRKEMVTFLPDETETVTMVLAWNAEEKMLIGEKKNYAIPSDTPVYTNDEKNGSTYADVYEDLRSGATVTMYIDRGQVIALFTETTAAAGDGGAVVIWRDFVNASMFNRITGGAKDYRVLKDGQEVELEQLHQYDVVTYDQMTKTMTATDLCFTCIYEDATPSPQKPEKITILGHEFPVLKSAWDSASKFTVGQPVALLLTPDGQVAGFAEPSRDGARSTAFGILETENSARMLLPNGESIVLTGKVSSGNTRLNRAVILSSSDRGVISSRGISTLRVPDDFNVKEMTLGDYIVAPGALVLEQLESGTAVTVPMATLDMSVVPREQVAGFHLNTSGFVDCIILQDVTGEAYLYGAMIAASRDVDTGEFSEDGRPIKEYVTYWTFRNHANSSEKPLEFSPIYYYGGKNGYKGVVITKNLNDEYRFLDVIDLEELAIVGADAFFEQDGIYYVMAKGEPWMVSPNVECCRDIGAKQMNWFTNESGTERLKACIAFANRFRLYVDPAHKKVRVIQADR